MLLCIRQDCCYYHFEEVTGITLQGYKPATNYSIGRCSKQCYIIEVGVLVIREGQTAALLTVVVSVYNDVVYRGVQLAVCHVKFCGQ